MRALIASLTLLLATPALAELPVPPLLRGEQILVTYAGAVRAPAEVTRTKEEARRRALEVIQRAKEGASFTELVKEFSDEPGGPDRGGSIGAVSPGGLVPALERALAQLQVGSVSPTPIETPFGFHVLRRLPDAPRMHLRMVLVAYKGALRASSKITRSREEAEALAQELARQVAAGTAFDELAKRQSDDPSGASGGDLGAFRPGVLLPALEAAALALEPGQVSKVVETPLGFHVLQRAR